jgi:hypothetical protein
MMAIGSAGVSTGCAALRDLMAEPDLALDLIWHWLESSIPVQAETQMRL